MGFSTSPKYVDLGINRFVHLFVSLKTKGLKPSPPADRRTLIRRAYLDLIGLPPSPQEIDAFVADRSPDAWPKLVDKLLDSPQYGERWARHWLDLVRYADSEGFEFDRDRPEAWRYRDYVVKAFNTDKPYDRFIKEQLAGDEYVTKDTDEEKRDAIVATGYLRLGPSGGGGGERGKQDSLDDVVTVTSMTFFGMTVGSRALPQPQVRSDPAKGLLPDSSRVLFHAAEHLPAGAAVGSRQVPRGSQSHHGTAAAVPQSQRPISKRRIRSTSLKKQSRSCPTICRLPGIRRRINVPMARG